MPVVLHAEIETNAPPATHKVHSRAALGLKGVIVGQGDTSSEAWRDVQSAIQFHRETFEEEENTVEKLVYGYTVVFEEQDDGSYIATVPGLNYITTEGETLDDARDMARDMIELYLDSLQADGIDIPESEADHAVVTEKIAVSIAR